MALGTLWAAVLVVGGAMVSTLGGSRWPGLGSASVLAGLTAVAAGEFVFLAVVGNRLFPASRRTLLGVGELMLGGALVLGAIGTVAALLAAGA
ncbi:MAG: hypothetical protein IBJ10_00165 [Phycisphaerales bacterium]|nr:hypothetical protein [Phycisphaerales bacterium]